MEYIVSKFALNKILFVAAANIINMDDETKSALSALWDMYHSCNGENIVISDLSESKEYIIWNGADDVRYLVESGCLQNEVLNMTSEEQEKLYKKVADTVDWSDVVSAGIVAGNEIIENNLRTILLET